MTQNPTDRQTDNHAHVHSGIHMHTYPPTCTAQTLANEFTFVLCARTHACTHTRERTRVCAHLVQTHTHRHTHTQTQTHTHTHTHARDTDIHIQTNVCARTNTLFNAQSCTHAHTHTHSHTNAHIGLRLLWLRSRRPQTALEVSRRVETN